MKRSMEKLAVLVMIVAIAIFLVAATASAGDHHRKTIHGEYGWAGPVHCISTPDNFTDGTPNGPASLSSFSNTARGTITFEHDGTGVVQFKGVSTTDSPAASAGADLFEASYRHTYNISDDGAITIDAVPNTYVQTALTGPNKGLHLHIDAWQLTGWVSADYKTMVVATPEPKVLKMTFTEIPGFTLYGICHSSFTVTRLSD